MQYYCIRVASRHIDCICLYVVYMLLVVGSEMVLSLLVQKYNEVVMMVANSNVGIIYVAILNVP